MKNKNTKPEVDCQHILHEIGVSFSTHKNIGGCHPDIIIDTAKVVIFVHGCFWHYHDCQNYHKQKADQFITAEREKRIRKRDKDNLKIVLDYGFRPLVIWECELENKSAVKERIVSRLNLATLSVC